MQAQKSRERKAFWPLPADKAAPPMIEAYLQCSSLDRYLCAIRCPGRPRVPTHQGIFLKQVQPDHTISPSKMHFFVFFPAFLFLPKNHLRTIWIAIARHPIAGYALGYSRARLMIVLGMRHCQQISTYPTRYSFLHLIPHYCPLLAQKSN